MNDGKIFEGLIAMPEAVVRRERRKDRRPGKREQIKNNDSAGLGQQSFDFYEIAVLTRESLFLATI